MYNNVQTAAPFLEGDAQVAWKWKPSGHERGASVARAWLRSRCAVVVQGAGACVRRQGCTSVLHHSIVCCSLKCPLYKPRRRLKCGSGTLRHWVTLDLQGSTAQHALSGLARTTRALAATTSWLRAPLCCEEKRIYSACSFFCGRTSAISSENSLASNSSMVYCCPFLDSGQVGRGSSRGTPSLLASLRALRAK